MNKLTEIKGICPIVATPFTDNGEVDYESLDKLVMHLLNGGCHAVTLFGIAGEYYKLSDDEREKMAQVTIKAAKEVGGKTIISVTDHSTEVAVKRAKHFEELGADCLMLLPPFFLKPGTKYLYEHMRAIANDVEIPIMTQYAPEQTGVAIPPETSCKLEKECPDMIYYKIECKPAGPYVTNLMNLTNGKMKIFVGKTAVFLASDAAASITGTSILMDNGACLVSDKRERYGF